MEVAQGRDSFQSSGLGILPWSAHRPDLQTPRGHLPGEASAPQIPRTPGTASLNRTSSSPAEPHKSPELCRLRTPPGGAPGPGSHPSSTFLSQQPVHAGRAFIWVTILPRGASLVAQTVKRLPGFDPWVGKIPWRRKCQPPPVFLPEKSHGQRSLVGYSPQGRKESDMTERLHFPFSLFSPENTFDRHTAGSSESISCRRGRSH